MSFDDLPAVVLAHVCGYLPKTSCFLLAAAVTAPSLSWHEALSKVGRKPNTTSEAILGALVCATAGVLDFVDISKALTSRITDEDLCAVLLCIIRSSAKSDSKITLKAVHLMNCSTIIGYGLAPLQDCPSLETLDLSGRYGSSVKPESPPNSEVDSDSDSDSEVNSDIEVDSDSVAGGDGEGGGIFEVGEAGSDLEEPSVGAFEGAFERLLGAFEGEGVGGDVGEDVGEDDGGIFEGGEAGSDGEAGGDGQEGSDSEAGSDGDVPLIFVAGGQRYRIGQRWRSGQHFRSGRSGWR